MSSCTNTRMNLLPLCTSNVCPTNSGIIVQARAQVFRGCLARFSLSFETLRNSFSFTNGPFFALLLIVHRRVGTAHQNLQWWAVPTLHIKYSQSADAAGTGRTCGDAESVFLSSFEDCG